MEYISKDDAKLLIDLLNSKEYSLTNAKVYLSIKDRLQKYIDTPESISVQDFITKKMESDSKVK
jgi:hypothetical protein